MRRLVISLIAFCFSAVVLAGSFSGGTGAGDDPYLLSTEADLIELYQLIVVDGSLETEGKVFALTNDITLTQPWNPISNFYGDFDGRNFGVYNVDINYPDDENPVGFFTSLGFREIKNFRIYSGTIVGGDVVGGIVGLANGTQITNCANGATIQGNAKVGGLVGQAEGDANIIRSFNVGEVKTEKEYTGFGVIHAIGGIAGFAVNTNISSCYNEGNINGKVTFYAGGLVGDLEANCIMENCYNLGKVQGGTDNGSLVGDFGDQSAYYTSQINYCYSDKQLLPNLDTVAFVIPGGKATTHDVAKVTTSSLTDKTVFGEFSLKAAGLLPYYTERADVKADTMVYFSSLILTLADGETVDEITKDFKVRDAACWSCSNHKIKFLSDGTAKVNRCLDGTEETSVIVKYGQFQRSYRLRIKNSCRQYTVEENDSVVEHVCSKDLPTFNLGEVDHQPFTYEMFDPNTFALDTNIRFATVNGCDSIVHYTIYYNRTPSVKRSEDTPATLNVLRGHDADVTFAIFGIPKYTFTDYRDVTYTNQRGSWSPSITNVQEDMDVYLKSVTSSINGCECSAPADSVEHVQIKVVDYVTIKCTVESGDETGTITGATQSTGTPETYTITPAPGYYLQSMQVNLDEWERNNAVYLDDHFEYTFTPSCDTEIKVAFAPISTWDGSAWNGAENEVPMVTYHNGDTIYVFTPKDLSWIEQNLKGTAPSPAPARMRNPHNPRKSMTDPTTFDWTAKTIILANDLDLGNINWNPVGTAAKPFVSRFAGKCHEIKALKIDARSANNQGLFGVVGAEGRIDSVAITSGTITANDTVGSIAGANYGTIYHCYNLAEINGVNAYGGGLVGYNAGTIEYAYNAAVVLSVENYAGGLIGKNVGTLRNAYNLGYVNAKNTSSTGATVGACVADAIIENVYFDKQLSGTGKKIGEKPDGWSVAGIVGKNSQDMSNIFGSDANWIQTAGLAPRLSCLDASDAGKVSAALIFLGKKDNGSFETADKITKTITLNTVIAEQKWAAKDTVTLKVKDNSIEVKPLCDTPSENFVIDSIGQEFKRMRVNIDRHDEFSAGKLYGTPDTICLGSNLSKIKEAEAVNGGDEDYHYMWILDLVDSVNIKPDTVKNSTEAEWTGFRFDYPGRYEIQRWAHDGQCQLDYIKSDSIHVVIVHDEFHPGSIENSFDTVCRGSNDVMHAIKSLKSAWGGDEQNITYRWAWNYYASYDTTQSSTDYFPQENDNSYVKGEDYIGGTEYTLGDRYIPDTTGFGFGTYVFMRQVWDGKNGCSTKSNGARGWDTSAGRYYLTIYPPFDAGAIEQKDTTVCADFDPIVIHNERAASQGLNTEYSWKVYDYTRGLDPAYGVDYIQQDIRDEHGAELILGDNIRPYILNAGMYVFTRWVSNEKCQKDAQQSEFTYTLRIADPFDAGTIRQTSDSICFGDELPTIYGDSAAVGGVGAISYRWLLGDRVIDGATEQNLVITDEIKSVITYNEPLSFYRQAKDSLCAADWQFSDSVAVVTFFQEFKTGAIEQKDDTLCVDCLGDTKDKISIPFTSITSAEGGNEQYVYRWQISASWADGKQEEIIDTTVATLNYVFDKANYRNAEYPITLNVTRLVKDGQCSSDFENSENTQKYLIASSDTSNMEIRICEAELPYSYPYTYADGHSEMVQFTVTGEKKVISDETQFGCPFMVTLTLTTSPTPVVEVSEIAAICETESEMSISLNVLAGNPTQYRLDFDKRAESEGFVDVNYTALPSSKVISIIKPTTAKPGIYQVVVQFIDAESQQQCESTADTLEMIIALDGYLVQKWNDFVVVNNSGLREGYPLVFSSFQWYRNNEKVDGAVHQHIYDADGVVGNVYYAMLVDEKGYRYRTCDFVPVQKESANTQSVLIYPIPSHVNEVINIVLSFDEEQLDNAQIEIVNAQGNTVYKSNTLSKYMTLQTIFNEGVYMLRFSNAQGVQLVKKFIVE